MEKQSTIFSGSDIVDFLLSFGSPMSLILKSILLKKLCRQHAVLKLCMN